MRKGHAARQILLTNAPAPRTEVIHDGVSMPGMPKFRCTDLHCMSVQFSPCGSWMALHLRGEQSFKDDSHTHTQQRLPLYCSSTSGVLYDVLAGFEHLASYQLGTASPVMRWCPGQPQLCIAQWPRVRLRLKLSEGVWAWDEL